MRQVVIDLIGADRFDLALTVFTIGVMLAVMLTVILYMLYGFGLGPRLPQHWSEERQEDEAVPPAADAGGADAS